MTEWSPHLSHGPYRRCMASWTFYVALLALAGSRTLELTEASCFGYIHPAVLTQGLTTVR